eukprot:SAG11_NODE_3721_length_2261_cov_2.231730_3_plen_60_part_00
MYVCTKFTSHPRKLELHQIRYRYHTCTGSLPKSINLVLQELLPVFASNKLDSAVLHVTY